MRFVELSTRLLNATFNSMLNASATSDSAVRCLSYCMRRTMFTVACNKTYSIYSTKDQLSTRCMYCNFPQVWLINVSLLSCNNMLHRSHATLSHASCCLLSWTSAVEWHFWYATMLHATCCQNVVSVEYRLKKILSELWVLLF